MNTIEKLYQKGAAKWTIILLWFQSRTITFTKANLPVTRKANTYRTLTSVAIFSRQKETKFRVTQRYRMPHSGRVLLFLH